MKRAHVAAITWALAVVLALAGPAAAQVVQKHSGVIADVDEQAGTFVLAELGPWRLRDGRTVVTYRTIALRPETTFAIVFRDEEAASGYRNDFVETPLEAAGVYVDDYVTVECLHEGPRFVALKITVTDLPGGALIPEN